MRWVQAQPAFSDLVLTVHSTYTNHLFRNKFRQGLSHRLRAVPSGSGGGDSYRPRSVCPDGGHRLEAAQANRFENEQAVCPGEVRRGNCEDFALESGGLPIRTSPRLIERVTQSISFHRAIEVATARVDPNLPSEVIRHYKRGGYLHVYIRP